MTWTPKLFEISRWARLLLPCFCLAIFPVGAESDTGDNPVEAAWTVPIPWPGSEWTLGEYLFYQLGVPTETPAVRTLLEILSDNSSISASRLLLISNVLSSVVNSLAYEGSEDALHFQLNRFEQSLSDILYDLSLFDFRDDPHGYELLVAAPDVEDKLDDVIDLLESIDYNIDGLTTVLQQNQSANENFQSNVVDALNPTGDPSLPDEDDVELPDISEEDHLEDMSSVDAPSSDWTSVTYTDLSWSAGSPEIVLWENLTLSGSDIPDGKIDLSSGSIARGVTVMGKISRTLWWLGYYTGIFLLLRREFVYYTSLGSTEGSS